MHGITPGRHQGIAPACMNLHPRPEASKDWARGQGACTTFPEGQRLHREVYFEMCFHFVVLEAKQCHQTSRDTSNFSFRDVQKACKFFLGSY